jgi:hypothetical protein
MSLQPQRGPDLQTGPVRLSSDTGREPSQPPAAQADQVVTKSLKELTGGGRGRSREWVVDHVSLDGSDADEDVEESEGVSEGKSHIRPGSVLHQS